MSQEQDTPVLVLVRDLLFSSKITATARSAGVVVKVIRDPARLAAEPGRRLLVDLSLDGAIEAAGQWSRETGADSIGFVSHIDTETAARAQQAGVTQVMSRGGFTNAIERLLT